MRSLNWLSGVVVAICFGAAAASTANANSTFPERPEAEASKEFIQTMADGAISVLSRDGLSQIEREDAFRTILRERFDFSFISNMVLGRHRSKVQKAQLTEEFRKQFSERVLHRYLVLLGNYAGEKVEVVGASPKGRRDMYVTSVVKSPGGSGQNVEWRVRKRDGTLQVVDVVLENISMVLTQREEIDAIIRSKGVDGMVKALQQYNKNAVKDRGEETKKERAKIAGSDQT